MPREKKVWWSEKERCWLSGVGGAISETSGRVKPLRNREIGPPVGPDRLKNQRLAHEWFEGLVEQESRAIRAASEPTLAGLAEAFIADARKRIKARTVESHVERLATFCAFPDGRSVLGAKLIRDLKPRDLARFLREKTGEGWSPVYINSILISVYACLNWAVRPIDGRVPERYLAENPFKEVLRPKNPEPERRYAGGVAHRAFFDYAIARCLRLRVDSPAWRFDRLTVALFRFCQATGCRPSEACRLEWGMIDREARMAIMEGKSTGATGKKRKIPIPVATMAMLRAIEKLPGRHPRFVFTHARRDRAADPAGQLAGVPWTVNALDHKFRAWRDEAIAIGQPIEKDGNSVLTLYALRRDLGADIFRLRGSHADSAEVLGHKPETNAKYYSSFATDHARNLADEIARMRKDSDPSPGPTA